MTRHISQVLAGANDAAATTFQAVRETHSERDDSVLCQRSLTAPSLRFLTRAVVLAAFKVRTDLSTACNNPISAPYLERYSAGKHSYGTCARRGAPPPPDDTPQSYATPRQATPTRRARARTVRVRAGRNARRQRRADVAHSYGAAFACPAPITTQRPPASSEAAVRARRASPGTLAPVTAPGIDDTGRSFENDAAASASLVTKESLHNLGPVTGRPLYPADKEGRKRDKKHAEHTWAINFKE